MDATKLMVAAMGAATLMVAGTGVTYAANGGSFILGHSNAETAVSTLTNNGSGSALSLKTKSSHTPPLAVSNATKITRLNADEVDGLSSGAFQRSFTRILVVHPGSTAAASGTALRSAVTKADGAASSTSPWLVFVEPGHYDLGANGLSLSSGVDLRGSGADATHVTFEPTGSSITAVVSNGDTVADMSIAAADAGSNGAVALGTQGTSNAAENLTLTATSVGDGGGTAGIYANGSMRVLNVSTSGDLTGVIAETGAVVTFIEGQASGGSDAAIAGSGSAVDFVSSEVDAATVGAKCIASYNAAFTALSSTCT